MGNPDDRLVPLRTNPASLPASLRRRNEPPLTVDLLRSRSPQFRTLLTEQGVLRPGPRTPRILSSAHGRIKTVLLTYPAYGAGEYSYHRVYVDLLSKLPRGTRFVILCHPSVVEDLQTALKEAKATRRATIIESPEYVQFLVWSQDPYVIVEDLGVKAKTTYFVEPFTFRRASDAVISDLVAEATAYQNLQSPLYFQGGNILIGDDFTLVGADYPANTLNLVEQTGHIRIPDKADPAQFIKELYQSTFDPSRRIVYVGTRLPVPQYQTREITLNGETWLEELYLGTGQAQPIFHIDMFISLAGRSRSGKYRVLVGSPQMADQLLGRRTIPHAMAEIFDDIARLLRRLGFLVRRNPLPLTYVDDPAQKLRTWYFASANNCMVQIDGQDQTVWLPTYGHGDWADLAVIDRKNKQIWESLGFQVMELTDFHPFAQNLGAVHCITKYLKRT
jgi:hypothetical protein